MKSRMIFFWLVLVINIEATKIDTNFLRCFLLVKDTLRYNGLFSHNFNK